MPIPDEMSPAVYEDNANDLSISFSSLLPSDASDVGAFLDEAALALGSTSADLARLLGVSRATLSGWKARGSIPATHKQWFQTKFVETVVLEGRGKGADAGFRHAGIDYALALYQKTNFNPFGIDVHGEKFDITICTDFLEGISALALFVQHRLGRLSHAEPLDFGMIDTVVEVLIALIHPLGPLVKRRITVSQ